MAFEMHQKSKMIKILAQKREESELDDGPPLAQHSPARSDPADFPSSRPMTDGSASPYELEDFSSNLFQQHKYQGKSIKDYPFAQIEMRIKMKQIQRYQNKIKNSQSNEDDL